MRERLKKSELISEANLQAIVLETLKHEAPPPNLLSQILRRRHVATQAALTLQNGEWIPALQYIKEKKAFLITREMGIVGSMPASDLLSHEIIEKLANSFGTYQVKYFNCMWSLINTILSKEHVLEMLAGRSRTKHKFDFDIASSYINNHSAVSHIYRIPELPSEQYILLQNLGKLIYPAWNLKVEE